MPHDDKAVNGRTLNLRMPAELDHQVLAVADLTGLSRSEVARRAIRRGLILTLRDALPPGMEQVPDHALEIVLERSAEAVRAGDRTTALGQIVGGTPLTPLRDPVALAGDIVREGQQVT